MFVLRSYQIRKYFTFPDNDVMQYHRANYPSRNHYDSLNNKCDGISDILL